ncbi:hypothetical protein [Lacunisphaera limnophila]|uniref:hypothetical protein n=1 Tax=Lacunisphaera limnophila TaxID=1838286 RepID=UPI0012FD62DA|nr:hypothetical protein [Lacunisphaera limnophila]
MDKFRDVLEEVIAAEFGASHKALSSAAGISTSLVSRLVSAERKGNPVVIGKIAAACSPAKRRALIQAYLRGIATQISADIDVKVVVSN